MRFAMICWVVLEAFVGQIHVFPLDSWLTILHIFCWFAEVVPAYLAYIGKRPFGHSSYIPLLDGREVHLLYLMVQDEEGARWRRELRTSCYGQWWLWVLRLTTHESGVVRGSFGCIFSTCFHLCSLFVPSFVFFVFFSQTVTSSLLIFSVVHSVFLLLKSNQTILAEWLFVMQSNAGRRVVCSARGGFSRVCYAGTLYPSNEGNSLVFRWIAVTLLWPGRGDFFRKRFINIQKIVPTSSLDCTYFTVRNFAL